MIRNDGSEVSLARLEQLYGKPRDITPEQKLLNLLQNLLDLKEG